jgi:hypothetical protein
MSTVPLSGPVPKKSIFNAFGIGGEEKERKKERERERERKKERERES